MPRRHQHHLEARALQRLVDRDPVDRGRFHRDLGHPARRQPRRHLLQIAGKGAERTAPAHRCVPGRPPRKCRSLPMFDPCAVRVHHPEAPGFFETCAPWNILPGFISVASGEEPCSKSHSLERGHGKPAPSVTEATKWFGPGLTSGAATARQCSNGLFTPPAASSSPRRRRHKPPLLPRPSRSAAQGGGLTTPVPGVSTGTADQPVPCASRCVGY